MVTSKQAATKKAHRIDGEQRRGAPQPLVQRGRQRQSQGRQIIHQAGDGVGFLKVPFRDEVRIEAVIGHRIYAADGPCQHTARQQDRIVEPPRPQQQKQSQIYSGGQEVQAENRPSAAHAVQVRSRQDGTDQHGQLISHVEKDV